MSTSKGNPKVLKNKKPVAVETSQDARTAQRKRAPSQAVVTPEKAAAKRPAQPKTTQSPVAAKTPAPVKSAAKTQTAPLAKSTQPKKARSPAPEIHIPATIAKKAAVPPKKKRTKAPEAPPVQETAAAADASSEPKMTVPAAVTRAPIPEPELWEKDSPVMRRISQLRTRNAQLNEQVQRLKKPIH
jgi:hypothetical protein